MTSWSSDIGAFITDSNLHSPKDVTDTKSKPRKNGLTSQNDFQTALPKDRTQAKKYGISVTMTSRGLGTTSNSYERTRYNTPVHRPIAPEVTSSSNRIIVPGGTLGIPPSQRRGVIRKNSPATQNIEGIQHVSDLPRSERNKSRGLSMTDSLQHMQPIRIRNKQPQEGSSRRRSTRGRAQEDEEEEEVEEEQTKMISLNRLELKRKFNEENKPERKNIETRKRSLSQRPQQQGKRSTVIPNKKKQKTCDVIEILDDSDSSDAEEKNCKQQLTKRVNASKPKPLKSFGELETFPLTELYIGEERFAFAPVLPLKSKRRHTSTDAAVSVTERPIKTCSVTVNISRSLLKFTFPVSPETADSPIGVHEIILFHHIKSIRWAFLFEK